MHHDPTLILERLLALRSKLEEARRNGDDPELARRLSEHLERTLAQMRDRAAA